MASHTIYVAVYRSEEEELRIAVFPYDYERAEQFLVDCAAADGHLERHSNIADFRNLETEVSIAGDIFLSNAPGEAYSVVN